MSGSREAMLAAVRHALADRPAVPAVPRAYRRAGAPSGDAVARFAERVADYRAEVRLVAEPEVPEAVRDILEQIGAQSVVAAPGLAEQWLPTGLQGRLHDDPPLSSAGLDAVDAVVTSCAIAVAETGTIVLDGGPGQGRRALTLIPDHHICIVSSARVVADVPDAVAALDPRRPLTWVSGPSATSDIELDRVEGVHGPRHLYVLIATEAQP